MQVHLSTDHNIEGHEKQCGHVGGVVENALSHVGDHITRVEVHLSDESGPEGDQGDKRCMLGARLAGRQPIAVTHHGATPGEAVDGAADESARLIASTFGRLRYQKRRRADPETKAAEES